MGTQGGVHIRQSLDVVLDGVLVHVGGPEGESTAKSAPAGVVNHHF